MENKPNFERLKKTLLLEEIPDRVPLCELLIHQVVKETFLGKEIIGPEDEVEFWFRAGYDYVGLAPKYNFNPKGRIPEEGERISKRTSYNILIEKKWACETKGIITTMEEFRGHTWLQPQEVDYSIFTGVNKCLPNGMKIIGIAGDIFTHVWMLMGFENFSYALSENLELVECLFNKVGTTIYQIFTQIVSFDNIGAIWYSDDIAYSSGLMISPEVYRKYLFPWMKRIGKLAKNKGIPYIYHSDGNLWDVLEDLYDCGFNAIHPIEPKAMDAEKLKKSWGDRFCLIGNVEVDRLARGTPPEIKKMVKDKIRLLAPGGGYCLGSSNSIPDYVPLKNYMAMINTAKEYGAYPVN